MKKKLYYGAGVGRLFRGLSLVFALYPLYGHSQSDERVASSTLKKLSLEELMNIQVTLVSRSPQKLTEASSAVQVITGEAIRRSGATNIPEALRLVANVQVAQLSANIWIISSRGFNTIFANKLLVMIDGRSVYTPFFGGVLWELQNVLLEDVDRIEIVSGPGGTLWGANAVNGVINIITKSSSETQGLYATAAAGTFLNNALALRYGGKIGRSFTYRVFGQHEKRNPTRMPDGTGSQDNWQFTQGGFQADWKSSDADTYMVQGNWYGGVRNTTAGNSDFDGQNMLGRWKHRFSEKSDLSLQLYFDRYYREDAPSTGSDELNTYDIDFEHRFSPSRRHEVLWGLGYRLSRDNAIFQTTNVGILPQFRSMPLYSAFLQDEIKVTDPLRITLGAKLLHNVFTGFEIQPSARLAWVKPNYTLWAAVSRAVRTPSRLDVDYFLPAYPVPANQPSVAGGPNFVSEKLVAYEAGYRLQPTASTQFSLAAFYNVYGDVYSVEALPGTLTYQIQNGSQGESWGAEFAGNFQPYSWWRLRAGYTYFMKNLRSKPGRNFDPTYLGNDAKNQVVLQSILNPAKNWEFDVAARYLDQLPKTLATAYVPAYFTFDSRLAYTFRQVEFSAVGQNLWRKTHAEFGNFTIPRSVYFKITARF